jgi:hypothetical protein
MDKIKQNVTSGAKAAYSAPKVKNLGRISVVTQKSGRHSDHMHTTKHGGGVG